MAQSTGAGGLTADHPKYKWVALSNTTLGTLIATINGSIVLISLPAIFNGIKLNPLGAGNVSYLLWMLMGYMLVTAVLVVTLGRLGDMFGRVRIYNAGFALFTVTSIALSVDPWSGGKGALWLIGWRLVQAVGGAMLMANSAAILTDAFPAAQRGMALGINIVAALAGQFIGLVLGGVFAEWNWRSVFWVNVPVGVVGTIWAYRSLREAAQRRKARIDWWGNLTFAVGLTALLAGITYGIQPYGGHSQGWTNPWVLAGLIGGAVVLLIFGVIETKVPEPMFPLALFRIPAFATGNAANLLSSIARGGLQFMLIIWLQGIWLPLHGYNYDQTPLWAGIYLLPLTIGFLAAGPIAGHLSDRFGVRLFAAGGLFVMAASFGGLLLIHSDFHYGVFAALVFVNGLGGGLFSAPNTALIMSSVPAHLRGAASGMRATFQNSGMVLSIGVFFSLMVAGLSSSLPNTLVSGLTRQGVPAPAAHTIASLPPVGTLFAAFLGYNPIGTLLGPILGHLPAANAHTLTGRQFFPHLISGPFHDGLVIVFWLAIGFAVVGALASLLTPKSAGREQEQDGAQDLVATEEKLEEEVYSATPLVPTPGSGQTLAGGESLVVLRSNATVAGTVRAARSGRPVVDASVMLLDAYGNVAGTAVTGEDGRYEFVGLVPGAYTLTASGYAPVAARVDLAGERTDRDIVLGESAPAAVPAAGPGRAED